MNDLGEAVCIFGSVARASQDGYSDKDVLIVSQAQSASNATIFDWNSRGWNVAFFTWDRLREISSKQGLFIQHLHQDGQIILDPDGELGKILSNFEPKQNYGSELNLSMQLLRCLDRPATSLWLAKFQCDAMYVFLRNAGILESASRGKFEFDFHDIVETFGQSNGLLPEELKSLHSLRAVKASYRNRASIDLDCGRIASDAKATISEIYGVKFSHISAFADARRFSLPYAILRDIEARLLVLDDPQAFDAIAKNLEIGEIWSYIVKPKPYDSAKRLFAGKGIDEINNAISSYAKGRIGFIPNNQSQHVNMIECFGKPPHPYN